MTSKWNGAPGATPGPWSVHRHNSVFLISSNTDAAGESIGRSTNSGIYIARIQGPDAAANAHQIAASGALYDALAEVSEWISNWSLNFADDDEWPETAARVRAALALARGEAS